MTDDLEAILNSLPSMTEQQAIRDHNRPLINALSIAVLQAKDLFGADSAEYTAACRIFDKASETDRNYQRLTARPTRQAIGTEDIDP